MQYVFNNTHHSSFKALPSKILLGYNQRNYADIDLVKYLIEIVGIDADPEVREESRVQALNVTDRIKEYNKSMCNKRHQKLSICKFGLVIIRD